MSSSPSFHNHRVLVVDDEDSILQLYREVMSDNRGSDIDNLLDLMAPDSKDHHRSNSPAVRFEVDTAAQGEVALQWVVQAVAEKRPYAVVILDMRMPPGWDGLKTARKIREVDDDVHVVFVTAYSDHTIDEMQHDLGKNTMLLTKPFVPEVVVQMVRTLCISWSRERQRFEAMRQLRQLSIQLEHQANHDQLTGLANRRAFFRKIDLLLDHLAEDDQEHAMLYLDLDQFKVVNDTCGHFAGDQLLKELSSNLQAVMGAGDMLARLGGMSLEFLLVVVGGHRFVSLLRCC